MTESWAACKDRPRPLLVPDDAFSPRMPLHVSEANPLAAYQAEISPATWRDLRPMVTLEKICFGRDSWPWLEILAALTFPGTVRLRSKIDERLVGFAIGDRRGRNDTGWIASIGVHPAHRRKGLGRQLLEQCERALGTHRVRLSLRESNIAALELYGQAGYARVDVWRKYYRGGEDALVMERILTD